MFSVDQASTNKAPKPLSTGEGEMLFPPLSHLEVVGNPRVELHNSKPVLKVSIKVSINPKIMIIDEMLGRRKQTVQAIGDGVINDADFDLKLVSENPWPAAELREQFHIITKRNAEWFNNDENFQTVLDSILKLKKETYIDFVKKEVAADDVNVSSHDRLCAG